MGTMMDGAAYSTAGMTALIVDDSAVARSILKRALRLSGIPFERIFEASNGEEALALLRRERVSVALVDLNMPVMGGLELLERARGSAALSGTPMIVVSTEGSDTQVARVTELCSSFLRKPFTPESVVESVRGVLTRTRDRARDEALFRVTARVLAELCFRLPEPDDHRPLASEDLSVTVRYSGPSSGQLSLSFAGVDLAELAGDMMGEGRAASLSTDAALELANVVLGHSLPTFHGAELVFELAPPRVGLAAAPREPLIADAVVRLQGGHVRARLWGTSIS